MKLTFCSNVVIFLRCFVLALAILGIPALAVVWDWLPGSWNEAVASIIPSRADREFETVADSEKTLEIKRSIKSEWPVETAKWGNTPLVRADEHEMYGEQIEGNRFNPLAANGFKVCESGERINVNVQTVSETSVSTVSDVNTSNSSLLAGSFSGSVQGEMFGPSRMLPEHAVVPSQTLVQTSSSVNSAMSGQPPQYYHGGQLHNDLLKEELNKLGVERFNLQQWGNSGSLWRCSCQVRGSGTAGGVVTCFEAVDIDSNRAIDMVLTKIRGWKIDSAARGI